MGFRRGLVSKTGTMPTPSRAGDGMLSQFQMKAFAAETDQTLAISELNGGHIHQGTTLTSDVIYTLPTAAAILAAEGYDAMDIGDSYSFVVTNGQAGAFNVVIAVAAGITSVGANNSLAVSPNGSRIFTLVKTSATAMTLH